MVIKKIKIFFTRMRERFFITKNPFSLDVPEEEVEKEVTENLKDLERQRIEWSRDARPLRSPQMEVSLTAPVKLEWLSMEETERDISMDELAQIEMDEGKKERDLYREREAE